MYVRSLLSRGVVVVSLMSVSASCGKSSSGANFNAPAVAPIVNASLPAGLRAVSATSVHGDHERVITPSNSSGTPGTDAVTYIKAMFNEYFINGIDGKTYQGYLNSLVTAIDDRMSGINTQISTMGSSPACLSGAVTSESFSLGVISSMLNFTAPYLQCYNAFSSGGGNVAGAGSGADFGTDGNGNYSLWLQLNFSGSGTYDQTGGFIAVANVINYGSTSTTSPETVDGLLLNWNPGTNNRITVARFTASPTTGSFALFLASTSPDTSGGPTAANGTAENHDSYLGNGLRLISDGTHVYADGILLDSPQGSQNNDSFEICLNASDLSVDSSASSDCYSLANTYATTAWASLYPTLGTNPNPLATTASLNYNSITGCSAAIPTLGTPQTASTANGSCPTSGGAIPGQASNSLQTTPDSTILTALAGLTLPSTLTNLSQ